MSSIRYYNGEKWEVDNVVEYCQYCNSEIEMSDIKQGQMIAMCPNCGKMIVLCDACFYLHGHREKSRCLTDCIYCEIAAKYNKDIIQSENQLRENNINHDAINDTFFIIREAEDFVRIFGIEDMISGNEIIELIKKEFESRYSYSGWPDDDWFYIEFNDNDNNGINYNIDVNVFKRGNERQIDIYPVCYNKRIIECKGYEKNVYFDNGESEK